MRILIIEDEKELSNSLVSYLKRENYICDVAANVKTALDKIETFEYDCIFYWIFHFPMGTASRS